MKILTLILLMSLSINVLASEKNKNTANRKPQSVENCLELAAQVGRRDGMDSLTEKYKAITKAKNLCVMYFNENKKEEAMNNQNLVACYDAQKNSKEIITAYTKSFAEGAQFQQQQLENPCSTLKEE